MEGWQFKITDAEGKVLEGSPFASNKDGIILTGNLLPGQYTVEELLRYQVCSLLLHTHYLQVRNGICSAACWSARIAVTT